MALALGFVSIDASALTLGRLNVQSTLGEPLRAEIDVTDISAAEADGLRISLGSPESFRAAGVPYSAALSDVRVSLQKRPDGRFVARLNGTRSMNDPFIDLLLEANWSSGRIVRDYTVLLDPPAARQAAAPVTPTPAQTGSAPPPRPTVQAPPPVAAAAPAIAAVPVAPVPRQRPVAPASRTEPAPPVRTGAGEQITVQRGDTASKIAATYKPADVSLDQMLVALLRGNTDAFIGGNVNRIKSGAVLALPSDSQARAATPSEASRTVKAQSNDFGDYRRRLAENAPASRANGTDRQASGKLQASVEERSASSTSPDKLKISQGGPATAAADDKLAQSRQAQATSGRAAELAKNLDDLKKLQSASGSATAPVASASAPTKPGVPAVLAVPVAPIAPAASAAVAAPASVPASAASAANTSVVNATVPTAAASAATGVAASTAASAPASASSASDSTSAPLAAASAPASAAAPAKPKVVAPAPVAAPEPGFFAGLFDNPLMLAVIALIAALIAFLLYRVLKRRRPDSADSVFLESKMPRDSFFGVSGGQQVDTNDRNSSVVSSLSYSPSQLDSSDVDPVAEADVYLAYGRDLQAEEILREAMRTHPERVAIPLKLLEIHAKRRDLRAFEALTTDIHKLTGGTGPEWARAVELGRDLDPGNPLYQSDALNTAESSTLAPLNPNSVAPAEPPAPPPPPFVPSVAPLDFDLDLPEPVAPGAPLVPAPAITAPTPLSAGLSAPTYESATPHKSSAADFEDDFDTVPGALEPLSYPPVPDAQRTHPAALQANPPKESGFIEFDMVSLSKRAPGTPDTQPVHLDATDDAGEHPHAIKLSLARELQAIGDTEGARSLVQEVASEGSGELQAKARQLLTQLAS